MIRTVLGTGMAALMLLGSSGLAADREPPEDRMNRGGDRMERRGDRVGQRLELTEEQREKFRELQEANRTEMRALLREMEDAMTELRRLVEDRASDSKIQSQLDVVKTLGERTQAAREKQREELARLLTPRQQALMILMMARQMRDRGERGGGMRGRPEGRPRR